MLITIIVPVPKSGCNIIRKKTTKIKNKIGSNPFLKLFIFFSLFFKYFDVKIMNDNFINSLGCTPNDPIPNQLLLPFLTVPTPGINTKTSSIKDEKNNKLLFFSKNL